MGRVVGFLGDGVNNAPAVRAFGFVPLPPALVGAVLAITAAYVAAAELLKAWF
jgi:hypothetical protein